MTNWWNSSNYSSYCRRIRKYSRKFFWSRCKWLFYKANKSFRFIFKSNVHLQKTKNNENNTTDKEYHKGISEATISIIEEKIKNYKEYIMIEEISQITGLSNQTVNKYMNHLVKHGYVDMRTVYGKIGRPRNEYLWIKK